MRDFPGFSASLLPLLLTSLFLPELAQTPSPVANPPAIDETVPPASDNYALGPDSQTHPGVPTGKTFQLEMNHSKVFPGTVRTITVYVPAAYKADKPACLYIGLDSFGFNAPIVFDNLIAQHAMPVTIGIGVSSGTAQSAKPPDDPRFDRSFEFDSLNGRLARFLLEEVIPEVQRHTTPDGLPIHISENANDRAIGGASTGAIAAFTVGWQRPDAFRRIFSAIGTFVGMRGGESYYVLVRKTEPKPLRIFMQDGVHDEWNGGPEMGDWWMSNQTMERALEFAGYDVRHVWGAGTHNGNQAAMLFPDAMRWLWRDWPTAVQTGVSANPVLKSILDPTEQWHVAADGCSAAVKLASNPRGKVFVATESIQEISNACHSNHPGTAIAFGPDGTSYRFDKEKQAILKLSQVNRPPTVIAKDIRVQSLSVRNNGDIYVTTQSSNDSGELWRIQPNGQKTRLDAGLKGASGLAFSPDGLWLFVAQSLSRAGISYRVRPDGTLDSREPFYQFYVPASADDSGAGEISFDKLGQAYVATRLGVQVFDHNGRVTAILPLPDNTEVTSLCFGDDDFRTLYAAGGGKIFKRKLKVAGAPPWSSPIVLPGWGAG